MKTIKHLLLVAITFVTTNLYAQKPTFGITAGPTIATMKVKDPGSSETTDSKTGFTAGVLMSIFLGSHWSIQPALNFVQKGGKTSDNYSKDVVTLNYLELPVNLFYSSHNYYGFFIGGGPALSRGISGKGKSTTLRTNVTDKGDIKFGNDVNEDDLKPTEFSVNLSGGYRFRAGLRLAVVYNTGLSNLYIDCDKDYSMKNRYIGIKLGYLLPSRSR